MLSADLRIGCKMDHALDLLRFEQLVKKGAVADVALVKTGFRRYSRTEAGLQIVRCDHIAAGLDQCACGVRTDVARAAQYKNCHSRNLLMHWCLFFPARVREEMPFLTPARRLRPDGSGESGSKPCPSNRFHTLLEGGFFLSGHIGLDRAGKAAAVYADCTVSTEQMLGQSDRHGHCLLLRLRSTVQICSSCADDAPERRTRARKESTSPCVRQSASSSA